MIWRQKSQCVTRGRDAETPTENAGGTDASLPVVLESVDKGMIALAFGAGGAAREEP